MKKVLFLQIKGNSLGGVWFVNKTLGEEFIKRGYDVSVFAFRNNHPGIEINNTDIKITTINKNDKWDVLHKKDLLNSLIKGYFIKTLKQYINEHKKLGKDYKKMQNMINEYRPDYIIASHYQTLYGVPNEYLKRVIFVQHSSFAYLLSDKNNVKMLKKLNNKIHSLCWLCNSTMKKAKEFGFIKNKFIYNPNKFNTNKIADVIKNKKISVITRIHPEKRIDLMIKLVNDVFNDNRFKEWTFDIYGLGDFNKESIDILNTSNQISYKGVTDKPIEILLNSSLSLNTSLFEGFSLSIIESYSCGLPVIAFNFGESAHEQIIDDYNGYVIDQNDENDFKNKLIMLLENPNKLVELSKNAKNFSKKFSIKKIADEWEKEFESVNQ